MGKPIYTCRVTQVESFRFWLYGQNEQNSTYNTEEKVIQTIKGEYTANVKADYGNAGHAIIESPVLYKTALGYRVNNFKFTDKQAVPLLDYISEHPFMVREIPISKLYQTKHFDLIITGTVDALEGVFIRDNKFKFSTIDMGEYIDSMQHRLYLDMLGLDHFYYDFFKVKGFEYMADCEKSVIMPVETMHVCAYSGMRDDIIGILNDLADWVVFKGLLPALSITPEKRQKILKGNNELKNLIG